MFKRFDILLGVYFSSGACISFVAVAWCNYRWLISFARRGRAVDIEILLRFGAFIV
ncbi:MAG: hypothetical protein ACTSXP_04795 [Promethearchaeota archaeon]